MNKINIVIIDDAIKAVLNGQNVFGTAVVDKLPELIGKRGREI